MQSLAIQLVKLFPENGLNVINFLEPSRSRKLCQVIFIYFVSENIIKLSSSQAGNGLLFKLLKMYQNEKKET